MDLRHADLHTHTRASDGQLSPAALVRKARERGLYAIAITDHDTVHGLAEGRTAGDELGVEVVTGVELSVTVGRQEIHLLGYFFDLGNAGLRQHLAEFQSRRRERAQGIVERLNDMGLGLPFDAVLTQAKHGALGRPHVALAMVEGGYVDTYQDAFNRYLNDKGPAFVAKPLFPAVEALEMLHAAGGIGVLAHPGHWTNERILKRLIEAGLDGIETIHPAHDYMLTRYYREIVSDYRLIETGGSDYHGFRPEDEENFGRFAVPYAAIANIYPGANA